MWRVYENALATLSESDKLLLMNDTPKDREPVRRVPAEPPQPYVSQNVAPKNDIFPYLMGALIAALVVGIGVLIFVLGRPNSAVTPSVPTPITMFPTEVPTSPSNAIPPAQPTNGTGTSTGTGNPTVPSGAPPVLTVQPTIPPGSSDADVPRMSMEDFKALYDDPAKRPIIIDVRTASGYDAGHIKGAISFPEEQIATLVSQLPKDKLVVAYCS